VKVADLVAAIDERIPFRNAGTWDRVGLQVGGGEREVDAVGVCHEVTLGAVDAALASGIDVLVAYHPLLFTPTTTFVEGSDATGRALVLAEAGISLIVVHTALDVARPGTADALLTELGLVATGSFGPVDDDGGADIGRIARLPEAMDLGSLASLVETVTGWAPRINMPPDTEVTTIGVVPGSGDSFVGQTIDSVDCYITGDVSHHGANWALSHGLSVIDAGHAPSESAGVRLLYSHVVELVPSATLLDAQAHPWRA